MPSFPTSVWAPTTKSNGAVIDASHINDLQNEVVALEDGYLNSKAPIASSNASVAVLTVTGGKITFPAVQSASAGANVLDDYEEGTWTPVIGGSGGTSGQTYTSQEGRYIKIGSFVWAAFYVAFSGAGGAKGTITGNAQIQSLPFTAETGTLQFYGGGISRWVNMVSAFMNIHTEVLQNTTTAALFGITAGALSNNTSLTTAHFADNSSLGGFFIYRAAN